MRSLARIVAAALIVVGGYQHFHLYRVGYRFIANIGVMFLMNAAASVVIAVALVVVAVVRVRLRYAALVDLVGIGLSVSTLAAYLLSRTVGLLGFKERLWLQPSPQSLITILTESAATLILGAVLLSVVIPVAQKRRIRASMARPARPTMPRTG